MKALAGGSFLFQEIGEFIEKINSNEFRFKYTDVLEIKTDQR